MTIFYKNGTKEIDLLFDRQNDMEYFVTGLQHFISKAQAEEYMEDSIAGDDIERYA